jgi:hypothetical protein
MPKVLERKLHAEAKTKGLSEERTNAYVYGTLRKTGWTPSTQKKHRILKKVLHHNSTRRK